MNPERLLALHERVADAPDAVPRLRRFVLDLAVRGKLVAQDPNDEPASELLKRIRLERDGQKAKRGRGAASTAAQPCFEVDLPSSWAAASLAEISLQLHYGYTASASNTDKEIRLLRITDIQDDRVEWDNVPGCEIDAKTFPKYALEPGDLLIARTGGTIGKTFLVSDVPVKSVFASYLIRVQPARALHASYVKLFCGSDIYWDQLREGSRGGGQPNVNGKTLGMMNVPLPPLAEQLRIVAKVEELMALLDRLEVARNTRETTRDRLTTASLSRLSAPDTIPEAFSAHAHFTLDALPALTTRRDQLKVLRQTILNLAVRGKLVEQDSAERIAERFLDRADFDWLPPTWRTLNFGEYCDIEGGNQPPKSQFVDEPRPGYVRLLQIRDLGEKPVPVYIPETSTNRFCSEGEILIGRYGASVGKIFWAQGGAYNVALTKFVWRDDALTAKFAFILLKSDIFQGTLSGASRSAQAGFNKSDLRDIDFPLPPLAEQHRIVAKVDELMTLCDRMEASLATVDTAKQRLLEALLREALEPTLKEAA